jgi:hypothetical protein
MGYEYSYQNIAEWLLLSMLIFIDSPLQILILEFFMFFLSMQPYLRSQVPYYAVVCPLLGVTHNSTR